MSKKNNVRHNMLRLAKSIAEMQFDQEVRRDEIVNKTLKSHPEFDSSEFKKMIVEFQRKQLQDQTEKEII